MPIGFDNQVALITGAAGGLGAAHALELARRGAAVFLFDKDPKVEQTASALAADGRRAIAFVGDVSIASDCEAVVTACSSALGPVDILVNNAGLLRDHSLEKQTEAEWQLVLDVHLTGTRHMTAAAWKAMAQRRYGRIVNTSSASGLYGNFGQTNYAAAKMGIAGFSRTCALEGERHGIRVNCVAPVALTPMTERLWPESARTQTDPALVSPIVAFLASRDCLHTGLIIACGGGYFARVAIVESPGVRATADEELNAEWVAERFEEASDLRGFAEPPTVMFALNKAFNIAP